MAYFVDRNSAVATKSELSFFDVPETQTVINKSYFDCITPAATGGDQGPWRFQINADPQFIQCNCNFIYLRITLKRADGTDIGNDDRVAPINLIGKTFWKQIKLRMNGQDLYDSGDLYAYKAYFETQFVYPDDAKNTHLRAQGYARDQITVNDDGAAVDIDSFNNPSFAEKKARFYYDNANHSAEFIGYLHANLFTQDKVLMDKAPLELELHRNSDAFCLMHFPAQGANQENYKIQVNEIKFFIMKRNVSDAYRLALDRELSKRAAKYPIRRSLHTNVHIAAGGRSAPNQVLFHGQIPRRLVIGFVSSAAFYGSYGRSPFNFKPFDIRNLKVKVNDEYYPDKNGLTMNFAENRYILAYRSTLDALDFWNGERTNGITPFHFKNSDCIFVVNLTPDLQDGGYFNLLREGNVAVDIEFGTAIPAGGVEMLVWAEYDNMLYIDFHRNFTTDYAR